MPTEHEDELDAAYADQSPSVADSDVSRSQSPVFTRRARTRRRAPVKLSLRDHAMDLLAQGLSIGERLLRFFLGLTLVQQIIVVVLGIICFILGVLTLVYHEQVMHWLTPIASRLREWTGGWLVLWLAIFIVSFPPLIGYGICVTLMGAVYGVWKGWLLLTSATVIGSTASFLSSRYFFQDYVSRMTGGNKRFQALNLVLKHDGLKLLIMIRLCPLPYSASNGFFSTIPTVGPVAFAFSTLCMCPKYLLHVFIGSRLAAIAENGDKMDAKTKAVSYLSIVLGVVVGGLTGWFMYTKTSARAAELEDLEEATPSRPTSRRGHSDVESGLVDDFEYFDELDVEHYDEVIEDADAISLHTADGHLDGKMSPGEGDIASRDGNVSKSAAP